MTRPATLGFVEPGTEKFSSRTQAALASEAEAAGFDLVLIPETWGRDAFTRAGYIAAHVESVGLGTGIIPVHSRSPSLIAQSIATLDELAPGGAFLGLGLSSNYVIEQWHGIEFAPALRRQRETIEIVRQALSGEPLDYEGSVFDVEHFKMRFEPSPDIPVCVGAQGPTNCELTGGFADAWLPNRIPLASMDQLRDHVDRGAKKQDRDPSAVETIPFATTCILDDGETARTRASEEIAHYIGAMGDYTRESLTQLGFGDVAETVDERWQDDEKDAAVDAVSDELLDEITVSGTPEQAAETIERYGEETDGLIVLPAKSSSEAEIRETIDHISDILE
ncbi:LLM class flavin-dependent oxidoreductase [Halovivax gelatinilyticus]|uniref:LLM class flavin-dependent oxidoreductase n=1 Tax=Halovivax gelatinilyticus TaxID=2961597 RepID=UPI0020CA741A|nr:LLM class flavin-dependent oxidoreductase [Halovivax gelatinilyticus]